MSLKYRDLSGCIAVALSDGKAKPVKEPWVLAVSALFLLCAMANPALAQRAAELAGVATDPSGALLVGVQVGLTNSATGVKSSTVTNQGGQYRFVEVVPGGYRIEATLSGFKTFVTNVVLEAGRVTDVDIAMQVGEVAQTIEVAAEAPTLETASPTVGNIVEEKLIHTLPIVIRRPAQLVTTAAAVTFAGTEPTTTQTPFFFLAGGNVRPAFYIDGGNATNTRAESTLLVINPNIEVTKEFRVVANAYKAEYGGSGGGLMLMTTKSGGNDIHGTIWEFHRQKALDARNTFAADKVPFREHTYGAAVGGPVIKNKLHYFGSFEGTKNKITSLTGSGRGLVAEFFQTLPTAAQRNGDFSGLRNANGTLRTIYDPRSTCGRFGNPACARDANGNEIITRQAFPNNIIPADRISPLARRIAAYLPNANNTPLDITGTNNFVSIATNGTNRKAYTGRLDYDHSQSDKVFFRMIYDDGPFQYDGPWPGLADASKTRGITGDISTRNPTDPDDAVLLPWSKNFGGGWTHIFSPTLISDFRMNYDARSWGAHHSSSGLGFPQLLGLPVPAQAEGNEKTLKFGDNNDHFPIMRAGRYTMPAGGSPGAPWGAGDYQLPMRSFHWTESITWIKGNHSFKFGSELRRSSANFYNNLNSNGTYNFADRGTAANALDAASGDAFASFLLDWVDSATLLGVRLRSFKGWWVAPYVQDDWRVNRDLTVSLGLRYELDTPLVEQRGNFVNGFDRNAINPVSGTPGVLTFPNNLWDTDKTNFNPRIGFAYNPKGGRTVFRGGFGLFTNYPVQWGVRGAPGLARPDTATNINTATLDGGLTTPFTFSQGLPQRTPFNANQLNPGLGAVPVGTRTILAPNFMDRAQTQSYNTHVNFNIEHQLSNGLFFEVGYLGNFGHHLQTGLQLNQIDPRNLTAANANLQTARPFPQFTGVQEDNAPIANSNYNALVLKAEKRFSNGLSFVSNYTWSKWLDDFNRSNLFNRQADRSLSGNHRAGRFVFSGSYELPFGKKRAFLKEGVLAYIAGDWNVAGTYIRQTGAPLTLAATNLCGCFSAGNIRPNLIGNPEGPKQITNYFNLSAFEHPGVRAFGNAAPGIIIGPGFVTDDISLSRDIYFGEIKHLNLRFDFFNAFNFVNWGNPILTIFPANAPGTTNRITSAGDPRRIQLGARFIF